MNKKKLYLCTRKWDGSSVGLERMLDRHEVTSSILVRPTKERQNGVLFFVYIHNLILFNTIFLIIYFWHNLAQYLKDF